MTILKGIDFRNPRLTRSWRIWLEYLCWSVQFWMSYHKPYLPLRLRAFIFRHTAPERHHLSWRMVEHWKQVNPDYVHPYKPLPWPIMPSAFGPFVGPWDRVTRWFRRHTGDRSHRCEFTDKTRGALYGGQEGGYMNKLFEQFLHNIETEEN